MRHLLAFAIGFVCLGAPALAEQQDGLFWLGRVINAAHKLNYTGTFSYRNGLIEETSRITHLVEPSGELERLEVLDGSPRELIRNNDEVKCYLPDSHTLIIDKRAQRRSFPALLQASLSGLAEYYAIRKGPMDRVAEHESQIIFLEPKDDLRYGQQLWIDVNSGLLLKISLMNERSQAIETFVFTQVQIGGSIERELLKSRYASQSSKWRVQHVHSHASQSRTEDGLLQFNVELPGFRKLTSLKRQTRSDGMESFHLVFSDGLAAISVFVEALPEKPELGMASMGAINVYRRSVGERLLVLMGEVPQATLKKLGDGIETRKR